MVEVLGASVGCGKENVKRVRCLGVWMRGRRRGPRFSNIFAAQSLICCSGPQVLWYILPWRVDYAG